jgi:hypothetical protein
VADLQTLNLLFRVQECRFTAPSGEAGMQVYNSFLGCRNHMGAMGYSLICLRSPDPKKVIRILS